MQNARVLMITPETRCFFRAELDTMHRHRKTVFVDRLKWPLPAQGDMEYDQFDHDQAYYLIAFDPTGRQLGSTRMIPTTAPYLLGDVFPQLCAEGAPRSETVWEFTRMYAAPDITEKSDVLSIFGLLSCAVMEMGLIMGAEKLVVLITTLLLQETIAGGWDIRPMGNIQGSGKSAIIALSTDVTELNTYALKQRCNQLRPLLMNLQHLQQQAA
jgi:N-acyl-L-homoserine lactone synthetase